MIASLGFIVFAFIVGTALVLVIAAAVRAGAPEGGDGVIKSIYVYLVLFATLMMIIGGSVSAFMAVADILVPTPYYQTFEDWRRYTVEVEYKEGQGEGTQQVSEAELRARYDAMVQAEKERRVSQAQNSLLKSLGWIIIPLPVFLYFQKLRKEA